MKGTCDSSETLEVGNNPTYFEQWEAKDLKSPYNKPLASDDDFDGPVSNRRCTELFWLLVFLPLTAALVSLSYMTISKGDIERVLHNSDFRGELCGVGDLSGREYVYWPDPADTLDFTMCLPGCPINAVSTGVCLYDVDHETEVLPCFTTYESRPFNHQCLPANEDLRDYITDMIFEDIDEVTRRSAGDLFRAWDVVVISVGISLSFALLYLIFFRFPSTLPSVIVVSATLTVLLFGFIAYLLYNESDRIYDLIHDDFHGVKMEESDEDIHTDIYAYLAYGAVAMGILVAIIFVILIPTLRRTVGILRISTRPLKNIPTLLLLPIFQVILGICVFVLMISTSIWAISVGEVDREDYDGVPGGEIKVLEFNTSYRYFLFFIIPMCIWWLSLIVTMGEFIATSSASVWFFSKEKTVLQNPIIRSIDNMLKYHMGSLIIAAAVVPLFRSVKSSFGWLKGILRKSRGGCGRCMSRSCCCCFEFHQRIFRYLHSDLMTFLAIWGEPFYDSGRKAYFLKTRSRQNIKTLATAGAFVTWMCSSVICLVAPAFTLYWIIYQSETFTGVDIDLITSGLGPAMISFAGAYYIAEVFTGIFRGCINSAIICFVADVELFIDNERFANKEYNVYLSKKKQLENTEKEDSFHSGEFKQSDMVPPETELMSTARDHESGNTRRLGTEGAALAKVQEDDEESSRMLKEVDINDSDLDSQDLERSLNAIEKSRSNAANVEDLEKPLNS